MPTWPRPHFEPSNHHADLALVLYTAARIDGLSVSLSRHGVPQDTVRFPFRLDHYSRSDSPLLFSELDDEPLLSLAADEGLDLEVLRATQHQILMRLRLPDPPDADHLRVGWGLARAICDTVDVYGILDLHARGWWSPVRLQSVEPEAPMQIRSEVSTALVRSPAGDFGHVVHTHGLRKFARPDLVLPHLTLEQALRADEVLYTVARHLASGARIHPSQPVVAGRFSGVAEAYLAGVNGPALNLNNGALVLLPEDRVQM